MMTEVGPVFIRSCLAQANFECDDIVTIDRYEPDALAICSDQHMLYGVLLLGRNMRSHRHPV